MWAEVFDDQERAVLHLSDAMAGDSSAIDQDLIDDLRVRFSAAELAEIVLVAGQANLNNRAGNAAKRLLAD